MKLKELAIEGGHLNYHQPLQLGRFSDGLTIVYGETGAGKTSVGRFIGEQLLKTANIQQATTGPSITGRISVFDGTREIQLGAGASMSANSSSVWDQPTSSRFNAQLYDSIFNVGFRETQSSLPRLGAVLRNQLGVPTGPGAAGDDSEYINWQRQTSNLSQQLESLNLRVSSLSEQKAEHVRQLESARHSRQARVAEVESRIGQINLRINELRGATPAAQLAAIDMEINQLRTLINSAPQQVIYQTAQTEVVGHELLYARLDEIDDQIRQWRRIQTEIQNQRVRLRDEMLIWNELTLDSREHPYHDARAILVGLEAKVEEAQRNASLWGQADIERVDATQLSQSLDQICKRIRDDLHGLCNELSQQYKHIRHKTAANELKQLRRYYTQMGDNIDRLIERRQIAVREIRRVDAAGAEAIIRADANFCEYAHREGHLAARRRFVGELTQSVSTPTYHAPDHTAQHARLALLEQQRNQIGSSQIQFDMELNSLSAQLVELSRQRDAALAEFGSGDLEAKVQAIELELQSLGIEANNLRRQIDELRDFVPSQPNALIQRACSVIESLSAGDLTQVFLSQPPVGQQIQIQVRDRVGKVLNASSVEDGLQDQVHLSLILAAAEQLQAEGINFPLVIDDAFSRIPPSRVTPTLQLLNEHGAAGKQIIALTQHRYLSDRVAGIAQLELAPPRAELSPPIPASPTSTPERRSSPVAPYVLPPALPNNAPRQQTNWQPEAPVIRTASSAALPYPLSKYPRNDQAPRDDRGYTVAYPQSTPSTRQTALAPLATPLPVQAFADQVGFVVSISESTSLRKIGFFDAQQIQSLEANNILTVGEFIFLNHSQCELLGIHAEQLQRWQDQLVLLTTVPGMRNEDARILVACGVTEPEQLDTLHPQQLFERVERFLGTTEGRRSAANSDPISLDHMNRWYQALDATRSNWQNRRTRNSAQSGARAASRRSVQSADRSGATGSPRPSSFSKRSSNRSARSDRGNPSQRSNPNQDHAQRSNRSYETGGDHEPKQDRDRLPRVYGRDRREHSPADKNRNRVEPTPRSERSKRRSSIWTPRESRTSESRADRTQRPRDARDRQPREARAARSSTRTTERKIVPRMAPVELAQSNLAEAGNQVSAVEPIKQTESPKKQSNKPKLKFYLDLNDHIEAAPSIGPKSAERFEKIGISTVADFLKQTAESISTKLDYKRMTASVIRDWQHQARLICRIPNLRGHDVQLLVACEFTEPEDISTQQPQTLFATIGPFSETKEGLKIIRNGKKPDLAEITDWIRWAGHTRSLKAA